LRAVDNIAIDADVVFTLEMMPTEALTLSNGGLTESGSANLRS
jgi:hypothetical protein